MKLIDALLNVDKSKKNTINWVDKEPIASSFGLCSYDVDSELFNKGIVGYWVRSWLCTDTEVGIMAIYLFDELVGYTIQTARKSDTGLNFISTELAKKVQIFVTSCVVLEDNPTFSIASENELNEELGDSYTVNYGTQVIHQDTTKATVNGRAVTYVQGLTSKDYLDSIKVVFNDTKETSVVHVTDYVIPYRCA